MLDDKGNPKALVDVPDPPWLSCGTERDRDPDVFRRPCFVRAISRSGKYHPVYGLLRHEPRIDVPEELIPAPYREQLIGLFRTAMEPSYYSNVRGDTNFRAYTRCPLTTISEMRNGVKTLVRQELDCSVPVTEFKLRDVLYGEWTVGAIDVLPWAVYYGEEYPIGASIRLRLHGDWRLALHERPSDDSRRKPVDALNIFFEPALFHNLLVEVFRVPFEGPQDYLVDGRDAKYDGVRVFQGRIYSPDYYNDYRARESDHLPPPKEHWWDQMSLLVTDSDPQYFCLGIALGTKDRP